MSNSPLPTTDPTVLTGARTPHLGKGRWRSALGASVTGTIGGVVFLLMCVASLILPWFIEVPAANSALIYAPPSAEHFLGTDADGRDVLTMILLGGRDVIIVSIISATVSTGIAVVLGALAAYLRGWVDSLVIQFTDFMLTIPQFALLVVLAAYVRRRKTQAPRGECESGLYRLLCVGERIRSRTGGGSGVDRGGSSQCRGTLPLPQWRGSQLSLRLLSLALGY